MFPHVNRIERSKHSHLTHPMLCNFSFRSWRRQSSWRALFLPSPLSLFPSLLWTGGREEREYTKVAISVLIVAVWPKFAKAIH